MKNCVGGKRLLILLLALVVPAGCDAERTTRVTPVAVIDVEPAEAILQAGSSLQLAATPRDAAGMPLPDRSVVWQSTAPDVATVSDSGFVTAVSRGTARVTASVDGIVGSSTLLVIDAVGLQVEPDSVVFTALMDTSRLTARVTYSDGTVATTGVVWRSLDSSVAEILDSIAGLVRARAPGVAYVVGSLPGSPLADTALVRVRQVVAGVQILPAPAGLIAGVTVPVSARAVDRNGHTVRDRSVMQGAEWIAATPDILNVVPASVNDSISSATLHGLAPGTGEVRVRIGTAEAAHTLTIRASPLLWQDAALPAATAMAIGPNGTLYLLGDRLTAVNPHTQSVIWQSDACRSASFTTLTVDADNTVYCGARSDSRTWTSGIAALAGESGSERWKYGREGAWGAALSRVGLLVVLSGAQLSAVNTVTGAHIWDRTLSNRASAPVAVDEARQVAYVATANDSSHAGLWYHGVHAYDLPTGQRIWSRLLQAEHPVESLVLGRDGMLVAGNRSGHVHAVSAGGTELWKVTVRGLSLRGDHPLVVDEDGTVFATGRHHHGIVAISSAGQILWEWERPGSAFLRVWAIDARGTLYALADGSDGSGRGLYAVRDGVEQWHLPDIWGDGPLLIGRDGVLQALTHDALSAFTTAGYPEHALWPMTGRTPEQTRSR